VDYAEINNPALDLAAYRQIVGTSLARRCSLTAASARLGRGRSSGPAARPFGWGWPLALTAQFLHAGADRGKVVSSAGSVHGASSPLFGLVFRLHTLGSS
jgi:hypothetical protein